MITTRRRMMMPPAIRIGSISFFAFAAAAGAAIPAGDGAEACPSTGPADGEWNIRVYSPGPRAGPVAAVGAGAEGRLTENAWVAVNPPCPAGVGGGGGAP